MEENCYKCLKSYNEAVEREVNNKNIYVTSSAKGNSPIICTRFSA